VRLDDPAANAKSHTRALRLGGEESLEQTLGPIDGKTTSRITNSYEYLTVFISFRDHGKVALVAFMASMPLSMRFMNTC
jgi:hypothetical protein